MFNGSNYFNDVANFFVRVNNLEGKNKKEKVKEKILPIIYKDLQSISNFTHYNFPNSVTRKIFLILFKRNITGERAVFP